MFGPLDAIGADRLLQLRDRLAHAAGARRIAGLRPAPFSSPSWTASAARQGASALTQASGLTREWCESLSGKEREVAAWRLI